MIYRKRGRCKSFHKNIFSELLERLHFCSLSYDDYSNYFKGKVNVGLFVSMNATKEFYDRLYKAKFEEYAKEWKMLGDKVILYPCYDTLQVSDYSKFNMASFDESKNQHTKRISPRIWKMPIG